MASGRDGCGFGCDAIQASTLARGSGASVKCIEVGLIAGRPLPLFSVRDIDRDMNNLYMKISRPATVLVTPQRA
jgi:hypothetical protein